MEILNKDLLNTYIPDFLNSEDFDRALILYVAEKIKVREYHRQYYHKNKTKIAKYYKTKKSELKLKSKEKPKKPKILSETPYLVNFD
tara:strand:- start:63 stop:323 length:261 start_codon:yes stop_codon:yes gene_type:complete